MSCSESSKEENQPSASAFCAASARELDPYLGVGVGEVALDRGPGEVQRGGYLPVAQAASGLEQYPYLPLRKAIHLPPPVSSSVDWGLEAAFLTVSSSSSRLALLGR
jgi:hypothetical protein